MIENWENKQFPNEIWIKRSPVYDHIIALMTYHKFLPIWIILLLMDIHRVICGQIGWQIMDDFGNRGLIHNRTKRFISFRNRKDSTNILYDFSAIKDGHAKFAQNQ